MMLGAIEGAVLDIIGACSAAVAGNKHKGILKKYTPFFLVGFNILIVASGMMLYKNIFSLFSIAGAALQVSALWITNERAIRFLSLGGAPFWLIYNLASKAYGSAIGSALSIVSLVIAIIRYDICHK